MSRRIKAIGLFLAAGLAAGCQVPAAEQPTAAAPAVVEEVIESRATVTALDQATRSVTLRNAEGESTTIVAGPDIRNLDQVKVGDEVVVRYREAIAAQLAAPGSAQRVAEATTTATRAQPGQTPGGSIGQSITTTVRIDSLDLTTNTVSFTGPSGVMQTIDVKDPSMQAFLKTLKVGDDVDITYTEALAISVEPATK